MGIFAGLSPPFNVLEVSMLFEESLVSLTSLFFSFSCGHISPPSAHSVVSTIHDTSRTTVALAVWVYWESGFQGWGLEIGDVVNAGV
jgi:hypothetical protein